MAHRNYQTICKFFNIPNINIPECSTCLITKSKRTGSTMHISIAIPYSNTTRNNLVLRSNGSSQYTRYRQEIRSTNARRLYRISHWYYTIYQQNQKYQLLLKPIFKTVYYYTNSKYAQKILFYIRSTNLLLKP